MIQVVVNVFVLFVISGVKGNVTYSVLTSERPYPWVLYDKFEALGNGMLDLTGVEETMIPWASQTKIEVGRHISLML